MRPVLEVFMMKLIINIKKEQYDKIKIFKKDGETKEEFINKILLIGMQRYFSTCKYAENKRNKFLKARGWI